MKVQNFKYKYDENNYKGERIYCQKSVRLVCFFFSLVLPPLQENFFFWRTAVPPWYLFGICPIFTLTEILRKRKNGWVTFIQFKPDEFHGSMFRRKTIMSWNTPHKNARQTSKDSQTWMTEGRKVGSFDQVIYLPIMSVVSWEELERGNWRLKIEESNEKSSTKWDLSALHLPVENKWSSNKVQPTA